MCIRDPLPKKVGFICVLLVAICEAMLLKGPLPVAFASPSTISGSLASSHQASTPRLKSRVSIWDQ